MPTGFLEGMIEMDMAKAELSNKQALARERQATAQLTEQQVANSKAQQAALSQIFGQAANTSPSDNPGLASQMEQTGAALMKYNPSLGLQFIRGAAQQKSLANTIAKGDMKAREAEIHQLGSMASAVNDQDSYDMMLAEAQRHGIRIPSRLTGNYEQDKNSLSFLSGAAMTAKDQQMASDRQQKMEETARKNDAAQVVAQSKLDLAKQKESRLAEHQRIQDEMAALKRQGKGDLAIAKFEQQLGSKFDRESKPITESLKKIAEMRAMLLQQNPAADKQVQQGLVGLNTDFHNRATNVLYGEQAQFGSLAQRIAGWASHKFTGQYADQDRSNILEMLDGIESNVLQPSLKDLTTSYEGMAKDYQLNPKHIIAGSQFKVLKPKAQPGIEDAVKASGIPYEPDKYDYRINSQGELQRRAK